MSNLVMIISMHLCCGQENLLKGILYILYHYLINLKVTNSGLIYGIDLKGVLLTNFPTPHNPLNVRPIDR